MILMKGRNQFKLALTFQDVLAAEVVQQIACVTSCGYDGSATTFTEFLFDRCRLFFFRNSINASSFWYKFSCIMFSSLQNLLFGTFLSFSARHAIMPSRSRMCGIRVCLEIGTLLPYLDFPTGILPTCEDTRMLRSKRVSR